MQEIRDRLKAVEVRHDEQHTQMMTMMSGFDSTQREISKAVQQIAINQGSMQHMGAQVDENKKDIKKLRATQGKHAVVIGAVVFVSGSTFLATLNLVFGWLK